MLVSLICGGVVANNAAMWMGSTASAGVLSLPALILFYVILVSLIRVVVEHNFEDCFRCCCTSSNSNPSYCVTQTHSIGFAAGYLVPKKVFGFPERTARTISIETGMQNSALAVVLAKSIGADPIAYLPGMFMFMFTSQYVASCHVSIWVLIIALISLTLMCACIVQSFLKGALSATAHSCLGSMLAAFWRVLDSRKGGDGESSSVD